jgi:hypothetical protein
VRQPGWHYGFTQNRDKRILYQPRSSGQRVTRVKGFQDGAGICLKMSPGPGFQKDHFHWKASLKSCGNVWMRRVWTIEGHPLFNPFRLIVVKVQRAPKNPGSLRFQRFPG